MAVIDFSELRTAYQTARRDLLAERSADGHWVGELSDSALSTATAVSALSLYAAHSSGEDARTVAACRDLALSGVRWLASCQNADGGWGDTDKSFSNIATTMLVEAAFTLAPLPADQRSAHVPLLSRARQYIAASGGIAGLRARYGGDKTFAVPILMNCALAGLAPWHEVSPLPFELACAPHALLKFLHVPVVSYAIPALVAVGQARYVKRPPWNPLVWLIRRLSVRGSLRALERMQPASGGYLEAVPLTSFVVMALCGTGRADLPVVRGGVAFLLSSFRVARSGDRPQLGDGCWPIDTNLATWVTTLSIGAMAAASGEVGALGGLDWLLSCQHREEHPFTHAAPGGWAWTDLSGGVPDADDTAGALLALSVLRQTAPDAAAARIDEAARAGVRWLLDLQNADGGWPTFCRGWGRLPFDRSATDLTAHALRALWAWPKAAAAAAIDAATERGLRFLAGQQAADGRFCPLWFGNQHRAGEENPVYGTGRVLLAYRDLGLSASEQARRGVAWLAANRCADGSWGSGRDSSSPGIGTIEETAVALEGLMDWADEPNIRPVVEDGLNWLLAAVREGRHRTPAPIGFYFAKLWYYEKLYPLAFTVAALGSAVKKLSAA